MNPAAKRFLYWSPRVLCILFAAFLSLFALDVFGQGSSFGETLIALFVHLIPVYVVIAVLLFAWRWEWVGAVLFVALGLFYLVETWGRMHWSAYVFISGPAFLVGALFLANWLYREQLRAPAE